MPAYALTIFTGAFLLFQVQPLIGKFILPWFGGGPGVWTTCLLFFQINLLAGYAYAHLSSRRRLRPRTQAIVHLALLAAAVALLRITPGESWKPQGGGDPMLQILALLAVSLGVPYFVLSSTGPLLQQWFSRTNPGVSPYRLYALSNAGSLLALLSYPFYFETHFTRRMQAGMWGWGLAGYALCCGFCALRVWKADGQSNVQSSESKARNESPEIEGSKLKVESSMFDVQPPTFNLQPSTFNQLLWLLLPACASALLLATTNKMCQDVAVIPFLWVLPLALYLLTFIICFDSPRWYKRVPFTWGLVAAAAGICWALFKGTDASIYTQVAVYSAGLFISCMVCHGELYRLRPEPRNLTGFYLMIAAGGAVGGLFVAVAAPLMFADYYELHWALFACAGLFLVICLRESSRGALPSPIPPHPHHFPEEREEQDPAAVAGANLTPHSLPRQSQAAAGALLAAPEPGGGGRTPQSALRPPHSNGWRWLACTLPLAAFGGLDWFLGGLLPRLKPHVGAIVKGLFGEWGYGLAHSIGRHGLTADGFFIGVRVVLWAAVVVLAGSWIMRRKFDGFRYWRLVTCVWLGLGVAGLGAALWKQAGTSADDRVYTSRNFYGVLNVYEESRDDPKQHHFRLQHGRITHGLQFVDPEEATWPTTYYTEDSGVGLAARALPEGTRRIGLVGLGTGTMAAYGRAGDYLRIYEINPEVKRLATTWFTYLTNLTSSRGKVEVALGDARLSMEREEPQRFDLLALDAFSGDAIPVHLLTKEAFEVYERHMKTNGLIAVHISNHYLDLEPVVVNLARQFRYKLAGIDHDETEDNSWDYSSTWILLSHSAAIIDSPAIQGASYTVKTNSARVPLWTDDLTSVFQVLK